MKTLWRYFPILVFSLLLSFVLVICTPSPSLLSARDTTRVEIIIHDYTYEYNGAIFRPDVPSTIVLINEDNVRHGFTSSFLKEIPVKVESKGVVTYGTGIKGVYIDPGETILIHVIPNRPGSFSFRCDIHPSMKGEILLLSVDSV